MDDSAPPSYPFGGRNTQTTLSNTPTFEDSLIVAHASQNDAAANLPPDYYAPAASRPASIASTALPDYTRRSANTSTSGSAAWSRWGLYASEQDYLDALRAWAREKEYTQPSSTTLFGFYGSKTAAEYADQQKETKQARSRNASSPRTGSSSKKSGGVFATWLKQRHARKQSRAQVI